MTRFFRCAELKTTCSKNHFAPVQGTPDCGFSLPVPVPDFPDFPDFPFSGHFHRKVNLVRQVYTQRLRPLTLGAISRAVRLTLGAISRAVHLMLTLGGDLSSRTPNVRGDFRGDFSSRTPNVGGDFRGDFSSRTPNVRGDFSSRTPNVRGEGRGSVSSRTQSKGRDRVFL